MFIEELMPSSYTLCDKSRPTNFQISYTDEFFSSDDTLTGYLSTYAAMICKDGQEAIPISTLLEGQNELLLNSFLVSNGLVLLQTTTDKKWTKDRKSTRQFWISMNPEKAKQQRLYLHGGNTIPYIELIANANRR